MTKYVLTMFFVYGIYWAIKKFLWYYECKTASYLSNNQSN